MTCSLNTFYGPIGCRFSEVLYHRIVSQTNTRASILCSRHNIINLPCGVVLITSADACYYAHISRCGWHPGLYHISAWACAKWGLWFRPATQFVLCQTLGIGLTQSSGRPDLGRKRVRKHTGASTSISRALGEEGRGGYKR